MTEDELNSLISVITPEKDTENEVQSKQRDKLLIILHAQTWVRIDELLQAKIELFKEYKEWFVAYLYRSKGWKYKESLIEQKLYEMLIAYCNRYWVSNWDYIFHPLSQNPLNNTKSKPISQVYYRMMLKNYWIRAWITKKLKSHTLRATFITLLHTKWLDIQEIKDAVWHNSIAMTSLYIKSHMNSKEKASNTIKKMIDY